ncbi:hypothetical protein KDL44_09730 [bacterium]|nr:hypothetical protein [bacterium]
MSPETQRFYTAYRLQTSIIPVYLLTALFFTLGWYFNPLIPGRGTGLMFGGVVLFLGISRLAGWLGFMLSRVPKSVVQPDADQAAKLGRLGPEGGVPLELRLVEIGNVPFLAAGGGIAPLVWLSTHSLGRLSEEDLRCLLEHERAHLRQGCSFAGWDFLWLLPWPLGWLLAAEPLYYLATAILFAWAWLRLQGWLRWREELSADKAAANACGRDNYARAMAKHLAEFETVPGSPLRRSRLTALGLSPTEIDGVLQD